MILFASSSPLLSVDPIPYYHCHIQLPQQQQLLDSGLKVEWMKRREKRKNEFEFSLELVRIADPFYFYKNTSYMSLKRKKK